MDEQHARPEADVPGSPWQTVARQERYRNPWMVVAEHQVIRPDGAPGIYGVVDPGDNVTVVALDDAGRVLLIRDFVYPVQAWAWSLPGGMVDPGEEVAAAAARELAEEAGITASEWTPLGVFWLTAGISPQTSHAFLARDLRRVAAQPEGTEVITDTWVPLADAVAQAHAGAMRDAPSVLALLFAAEWLRTHGAP